ncbi:3-dehydroquinate synthase [Natranaerovirga pectinivora]|uniref:3-dehydroquinate synthase n=1 Tax=Natranaerovirga pectinivora TaxID=682400 RepID=A0A4R3MNK3_9FIRM|nr:3-dehydroquinate synthase [Natranaerovirga pectinivora]TCT14950.1 3-dehydroquinate synthase [Natranaerovirga pectinivora]
MNRELQIKTKDKEYPIKFCQSYEGLLGLLDHIDFTNKKVCIVTDTNVGNIYLEEVKNALGYSAEKVVAFTFPAGEENKTLNTVYELYELLINEKFDRKSILIALGGGVVGDLTGFTASTYLRGIDFIQMPTSLLSQVDSSIGGKTGVDFKGYKNMVGAFYQPRAVIINTKTIDTLPKNEFSSGMAEIIKHALIKDLEYLDWLEKNSEQVNLLNQESLTEMIYRSCCIKKDVVEKDEKEENIRALLNFGHTVGHAIEKIKDFTWLHGECVSVGMVVAAYLSYKRGYISKEKCYRINNVLVKYNLPIEVKDISPEEIIKVTKLDKKVKSSVLHFILLNELGVANIYTDVTDDELLNAINNIIS